MSATLPASHLVRQYFLFVLTVIFLLTMVRAGYALWKFPELEETQAFVPLFLQGLRFDLALIGIICLIPVVVGSLLSMTRLTRGLAKFVISAVLFAGLVVIVLLELITPAACRSTRTYHPTGSRHGALSADNHRILVSNGTATFFELPYCCAARSCNGNCRRSTLPFGYLVYT